MWAAERHAKRTSAQKKATIVYCCFHKIGKGNHEQNLAQNQFIYSMFLSRSFGKAYHHDLNILSIGIPSAAIVDGFVWKWVVPANMAIYWGLMHHVYTRKWDIYGCVSHYVYIYRYCTPMNIPLNPHCNPSIFNVQLLNPQESHEFPLYPINIPWNPPHPQYISNILQLMLR